MNNILELYDAEVRANPLATAGLSVTRDEHIVRIEGAFNYICSWTIPEDATERVVSEQADYFRKRGEGLMWRVYSHDKPGNLEACLEREGFAASPSGTLVVLDVGAWKHPPSKHDIRRVETPEALRDYLAVAAAAFGDEDDGKFEYFSKLLSNPKFALFTGYADEEPVVSGRLEIPAKSSFGQLFGGGVSPGHRGKGFYRALVGTRVALARERGLKYLSTEARETSRPILEKLGFTMLAKETTWVLSS
ncbi:GNAT family N-acetyltransferase [Novipirellula sp. SH528]|uniref:GNAT family N-acetyltransferase n=1 Tax=Novipirellula sp. SH528 TaxID=3454466 RepID=UPI003F9F7B2B